jgi:hypothetical protein
MATQKPPSLLLLLLLVMEGAVQLQGHSQPAVLVVPQCCQLRAFLLLLLLLLLTVSPAVALQRLCQGHCSHLHQVLLLLLHVAFLQLWLHHS